MDQLCRPSAPHHLKLMQNISTLVLESPFYGLRKPAGQKGSKLLSVTDLLLLGLITISEGLHLLQWASTHFPSIGETAGGHSEIWYA